MRYFRLQEDERAEAGIIMKSVYGKPGIKEAINGNLSLLEELTVAKANMFKGSQNTVLLSRQIFMYKEIVREVFDMFLPDVTYKNFCIINIENERSYTYFTAPMLKIASALSEKSIKPYHHNGKIYLDKRALQDLDEPDIFYLKEHNIGVIVSLAVAESLLRRNIPRIRLTHLKVL